ncbi:MAG: DUF1700 domain-containing protein [Coriobacteriaceae bacterium]|nr:DUF1700 domain-containing protein [Coriobacteriaceae bacterium]MDO4437732.1 DUF1700 domain-containing protein [Coriobacteriaceae bacterium]
MTKQAFLAELEHALGKLPRADIEQALAFYDEAISDRMEDGLSEDEAVASLGPVSDIAAQITAELPPVPRAIARANTGSRTLNIVLLALFSPIWVPIILALAIASLAIYASIWAVIASLVLVDAILVLMPVVGLYALVTFTADGAVQSGIFVLGGTLIAAGLGLVASFAVLWVSKLLFRVTKSFARWIAGLFVRVGKVGHKENTADVDAASDFAQQYGGTLSASAHQNGHGAAEHAQQRSGVSSSCRQTDSLVSAESQTGSTNDPTPHSNSGDHHA